MSQQVTLFKPLCAKSKVGSKDAPHWLKKRTYLMRDFIYHILERACGFDHDDQMKSGVERDDIISARWVV